MPQHQEHSIREVIAGFDAWAPLPALLDYQSGALDGWSYGELRDQVRALSAGLIERGIGRGKAVAILAPNSRQWVAACLAVIDAGAVAVPLDSQLDRDSLAHVLSDAAVDLVLTTGAVLAELRALGTAAAVVRLDAAEGEAEGWQALRATAEVQRPALEPGDTAVMFYTSGTTGPPKGVPLSHRNLLFQLETLCELRLMSQGERLLLPLPLHHVYPFVVGMLGALALGVAVVFPRSLTGPHVLQALREGEVATVIAVPRFYDALVAGIEARVRARGRLAAKLFAALLAASIRLRRSFGLSLGCRLFRPLHKEFGRKLRLLASGGAALDPALAWKLEGLGWTVSTGYGLTETAPLLAMLPPGDWHFDSAGKAVPGVELRIAQDGREGDERRGEIQARGPNVFAGYHNLPDRSARAFTADGWFRTEDRGSLDRAGYLQVHGRAATLLVTEAGENIDLEKLEAAYQASPLIREIGVLQDAGRLVAVVVPESHELRRRDVAEVTEALRRAIRARSAELPSYGRLADFVIDREALARTRLGKIRRPQLDQRFQALKSEAAAPGAPIRLDEMAAEDRALLEDPQAKGIWDWLVARYPERRLTPDSSLLLDLGIDSLEWINLTLDIERRTGVELSEGVTARVESVRDLLQEVVAEPGEAALRADPIDQPESYLTAEHRRWLIALSPVEAGLAWLLYQLNRLLMRGLFRLRVEGLEQLPSEGGFLLTPNHQSLLDPLIVAAALPYPVLRRSYFAGWTGIAFANPLYRLLCRLAQAFPVEHERAAFSSLALAAMVLRRDRNLIWFPEGARSLDGELQPFKAGIGLLLAKFPRPVVPALIEGSFAALPRGKRLPRLRRLSITLGPAIAAEQLAAGDGDERPELRIAQALQDEVAKLQQRASDADPG
jgi:long-chain acyl-CoA synthetase